MTKAVVKYVGCFDEELSLGDCAVAKYILGVTLVAMTLRAEVLEVQDAYVVR